MDNLGHSEISRRLRRGKNATPKATEAFHKTPTIASVDIRPHQRNRQNYWSTLLYPARPIRPVKKQQKCPSSRHQACEGLSGPSSTSPPSRPTRRLVVRRGTSLRPSSSRLVSRTTTPRGTSVSSVFSPDYLLQKANTVCSPVPSSSLTFPGLGCLSVSLPTPWTLTGWFKCLKLSKNQN